VVNSPVLVLNQNYEPLNVARARRAVILVLRGKAELLENGVGVIHTPNELIPLPSVIRLVYLVKRPRRERKLTRHEVFHRDDYTCQYCSRQSKQLTLDHVVPRYKGGATRVGRNVASACMNCNNRKAGRTPEGGRHEAGSPALRLRT